MKKKPQNKTKKDYYSRLQSLSGEKSSENSFFIKKYQDLTKYQTNYAGKFYEIVESKVKLTEVIQANDLKEKINDLIDEYKFQNKLIKFGLKTDNKIIFHGPSGCGKTLTALALANALKKKIYLINLSTIVSSSLGKTSTNLFEIIEDAKVSQAIVFFDEFDALSKMRKDENEHGEMKRVTSSLLQVLDFLEDDTILIAATNYPDLIDEAIIRRFNKKINFPLPDLTQLLVFLNKILKEIKFSCPKVVLNSLAKDFEGLSYAEVRDQFISRIKKVVIKNIKDGKKDNFKLSKEILKYKN